MRSVLTNNKTEHLVKRVHLGSGLIQNSLAGVYNSSRENLDDFAKFRV